MADELEVKKQVIDWQAVFEALGDTEPDLMMAKAVHRTACGNTTAQICKELGVPVETVRAWVKEDRFKNALAIIKENFGDYLSNRLSNRIVQADDFMDWILAINPFDKSIPADLRKDVLREKGMAARTVFAAAVPKKSGTVNNTIITPMAVNLTESAAKILLSRVNDKEETTTEDTIDGDFTTQPD